MRFQDQAVLVTGGGSGIGQQVCYAAGREGARVAVGDLGIRVNAVAPGVVRTPLTERYFQDPEMAETIRGIHALGRWAEPAEIATAILFLAAEENGFITGTVLTVDGGWTAGKRM